MPETTGSLLATLVAAKGVAVAAWFVLLFAGERLAPAAPRPMAVAEPWLSGASVLRAGGWARLGRNLALWLVNTVLSPLVVLPLTVWAAGQGMSEGGLNLGLRPAWWSGAGGLVADLLLLDFLIYWWHRANHRAPFLWRFHAVHHLDGFLDTTSALRFHFGEVLLSALARAAVIVAFGIPLASVLAFEALLLVATIFHHSNLRLPAPLERGLAAVIVTPSIHWVHHHARRRDTDANYATILSLWDPLFGSRSTTARGPDMKIGVEGQGEESLAALLSRPFRRI
jgi:sterol desaturase/sphingolipid hydroxylase (fatty acid hydroxylase superfamily)